MKFQVGDILKFSHDGLFIWIGRMDRTEISPDGSVVHTPATAPPDEPRRQWRWKVEEVGTPSILLKRIDGQSRDRDWWSPHFFEKVIPEDKK
jgi:hypothetical protein